MIEAGLLRDAFFQQREKYFQKSEMDSDAEFLKALEQVFMILQALGVKLQRGRDQFQQIRDRAKFFRYDILLEQDQIP